ncbi:hypothetical protein IW261DRAFT_1653225 [Armillaria novae-zelandiae]|uniref:DUF6534 domain-containing protein n=1 Tax=Armillaria novae-zelandiae TaxID=153914 RepID=A0AA39PMZ3_9AGAR|nr:hypothetical protein IW261DRAFT_1653225 [Armillaria novae-zelandiae]
MNMNSTYGSAFIGLIVASMCVVLFLYLPSVLKDYRIDYTAQRSSKHISISVEKIQLEGSPSSLYPGYCPPYTVYNNSLLVGLESISFVPLFKVERRHLITNFSDVSSLDNLTWSMNAQTGFNGLIALIVECIFARRVFIRAVFDDPIKHDAHSLPVSKNGFITTTIWVTSAGNGSSAAADILIAASLCFYLSKNRTGHRKTDSLITTLIGYSLTTGLVSSLIRIVIVITFATMPNNYIWLAFCWVGGKCYVNSFLASLNCRNSLRDKATQSPDTTSPQLTTFQAASAGTLHLPARALSKTQSLMPLIIKSTTTKTEGDAITKRVFGRNFIL